MVATWQLIGFCSFKIEIGSNEPNLRHMLSP